LSYIKRQENSTNVTNDPFFHEKEDFQVDRDNTNLHATECFCILQIEGHAVGQAPVLVRHASSDVHDGKVSGCMGKCGVPDLVLFGVVGSPNQSSTSLLNYVYDACCYGSGGQR
jgi:hypothetical protein